MKSFVRPPTGLFLAVSSLERRLHKGAWQHRQRKLSMRFARGFRRRVVDVTISAVARMQGLETLARNIATRIPFCTLSSKPSPPRVLPTAKTALGRSISEKPHCRAASPTFLRISMLPPFVG